MFLLIFEGLGTSELLLILIVALVLFGPRKLPKLSRSIGRSLADFKRASEDFKQTWEKEVERESAVKEALIGEAMLPEDRSVLGGNGDRTAAVLEASESSTHDSSAEPYAGSTAATLRPSPDAQSVARGAHDAAHAPAEPTEDAEPTRKRDWL